MNYNEMNLKLHGTDGGKIRMASKVPVKCGEDLSVAYIPEVAESCRKISAEKSDVYRYTARRNLVTVVTDGTAVLGFGDIGPGAAMPVIEGKTILSKEFAGVDAFPICLGTKDTEKITETVKRIAPGFGGVNLRDISVPRCFEVKRWLKEELDIPVFHDDQYRTATVATAELLNSLRLVGKRMKDINIAIDGAGLAGISICHLPLESDTGNAMLMNRQGAVSKDEAWLNSARRDVAERTNHENERGPLTDIMRGKGVFIGVSTPSVVTAKMVASTNHDATVFAMANPAPGIMPKGALESGARVVAMGRSDHPNRINNVLVFPDIFHGALGVLATGVAEEVRLVATRAIASIVKDEGLKEGYIVPGAFNPEVTKVVTEEVGRVVKELGTTKEV